MTTDAKTLDIGWAILELMGHRKLAGLVRPVELGGSVLLRIDVPAPDAADESGPWQATQFYSPAAVYCITPCTRDTAVAAARVGAVAPVQRWELPAAKPAPAEVEEDVDGHRRYGSAYNDL